MGEYNGMNTWFALMSLINFQLNTANHERNIEETERQKRIEQKLDKLLEMLEDGK